MAHFLFYFLFLWAKLSIDILSISVFGIRWELCLHSVDPLQKVVHHEQMTGCSLNPCQLFSKQFPYLAVLQHFASPAEYSIL